MSSTSGPGQPVMADEKLTVSRTIDAPAAAVFAVLADPATHPAIDGTGWVRESLDGAVVTGIDQVFRVAMHHPNHPRGDYEMANQVIAFDPPRAIAWKPGQDRAGDGNLQFGGWTWRYDLAAEGPSRTEVTLTYDWSAVPAEIREYIAFPPFGIEHLENSLEHLDDITAARA